MSLENHDTCAVRSHRSFWLGRGSMAALAVLAFGVAPTSAQDSGLPAAGNKRYALVKSGDDILRIDRQAGSVSFCRKSNDIWRCMPAPLAEEAYQSEIAALSDEVSQLKSRIAELESAGAGDAPDDEPASEKKEDQLTSRPPETETEPSPEVAAPPSEEGESKIAEKGTEGGADPSDVRPEEETALTDKDEQELEEMLQFSEKAMRRFFGLMKDLKQELEEIEID